MEQPEEFRDASAEMPKEDSTAKTSETRTRDTSTSMAEEKPSTASETIREPESQPAKDTHAKDHDVELTTNAKVSGIQKVAVKSATTSKFHDASAEMPKEDTTAETSETRTRDTSTSMAEEKPSTASETIREPESQPAKDTHPKDHDVELTTNAKVSGIQKVAVKSATTSKFHDASAEMPKEDTTAETSETRLHDASAEMPKEDSTAETSETRTRDTSTSMVEEEPSMELEARREPESQPAKDTHPKDHDVELTTDAKVSGIQKVAVKSTTTSKYFDAPAEIVEENTGAGLSSATGTHDASPTMTKEESVTLPADGAKSVMTSDKDITPYLTVSLSDKELLNKLKWKSDTNIASLSRQMSFRSKTVHLENCLIELEQSNVRENVRITWEKTYDAHSYEPSISPASPGITLDFRHSSVLQCIYRGLIPNTKYTITVALTSENTAEKKKKAFIVFRTGPEAPSNIRMEGNILKWTKAQGAEKYVVKVASDKERKVTLNEVKLRNDPRRNGQQVTVSITAISVSGLQKTKQEQQILFGSPKSPRELRAELNKDDPCRSIDVHWSDPDQGKPDRYKLVIFDKNDKSHYDDEFTRSNSHTFRKLMSDTGFYVEVTAIFGKNSNSSHSNVVNTEFRKRNQFDIKDFGLVHGVETVLVDENESVKCNVKWKLPGLGTESNNYDRLKVIAMAKDATNPKKNIADSAKSETAHSFTFEWGRKYEIAVTATYRDLDVLQEKNAVITKTIVTEFEAPSEIIAEAEDDFIKISWRRARGARAYRVLVFQGFNICVDSKTTISSPQNSFEFKRGHQFSIGSDFKIEVRSVDFVGNEKTETVDKVFLGRNDEPKDATISVNENHPYRSLDIEWKTPKINVSKYECTLCTTNGIPVDKSKLTSQTKVNFDGLKQDEVYYGIIQSIKADGQKGSFCHTKICRTKSGKQKRSPNEITENGRVGKLWTSFHKTLDGNVNCNMKWNNPPQETLQEDFELMGFEMECKEKSTGELVEPIKLFPVGNHNEYKYFVEILPGKIYIICVSALYKDRDSRTDFKAIFEEEISPDMCPPDLKIKNSATYIALQWNKVKGASEYAICIKDVSTGNTAFEQATKNTKVVVPIKNKLDYGQLCDFFLSVKSSSGKTVSSKPVRDVVGGTDLPHSLRLQNVPNFPRRLRLTWAVSERGRANIKEVILYEKDNNNQVEASVVKEVAEFRHLKSTTCYHAEIRVIRSQGNVVCRSDKVTTTDDTTDYDLLNKNQELPKKIWFEEGENGAEKHLRWEGVDLGEAYKTVGYNVEVVEVGGSYMGAFNLDIVSKRRVPGNVTMQALPVLKDNANYQMTIQPQILLIDREEETMLTAIEPPVMRDPTYDTNFVIFQWEKIAAADKFSLQIKDAFSHELIREEETVTELRMRIQMTGKLRIGRRCEVGLTARNPHTKSILVWKPWTIGGDEVPRDVTVDRNCNNPCRCIDIRFKKPDGMKQPETYLIRACPFDGRKKTEKIPQTEFMFKNLRSGTLYHFEVSAIYENGKSLASKSADITTDQDLVSGNLNPGNTFIGAKNPIVSYTNTTVQYTSLPRHGNAGVDDTVQNADFGELDQSQTDKDVIRLAWSPPYFSNNSENFLVESYLWEGREENTTNTLPGNRQVVHQENVKIYTTEPVPLKLGNSYKFWIKAQYENLDLDRPGITSQPKELVFHTRPCMPGNVECVCDYEAEKLNVKWNAAAGADAYRIELYIYGQSAPKRAVECKKQCISFSWDLFKDVEFGDEFYVVVIAINAKRKEHSAKSETKTIGGYAAPRQARASIDPESLTTAAIVQWESPKESPDSYVVQAVLKDSSHTGGHTEYKFGAEERNVLIKGLEPGTAYIFVVFAVHKSKRSPGCKTNAVNTCAGPGKTEITEKRTCQGEGSKAIYVKWKRLDRCNEYKLVAVDEENDMIRTFHTASTNYTIRGLSPRTKYKISVTGGSGEKKGFGNASAPVFVKTDKGFATRVALKHSEQNPESKLTLSFEETGEDAVSYRVVLYKEKVHLGEQKAKTSPVEFANLASNKNYRASVEVLYSDGKRGKEVLSNEIYTAPCPPENFTVEPKVADDVTLPVVKLKWSPTEGCNVHEVNIIRATTPEATLIVKGINECEYRCLDETCDYSFTVATANSSGTFSKPSKEFRVKFAPAKISKITATLNEATGKLKVNWDKSDNKVQSYIVCTIADGNAIQSQKTSETYFELTVDNKTYREYAFMVSPEDDAERIGHGTKSNTVQLKPPDVEMISVQPDQKSPTTSMVIIWKGLLINDIEYEVEISPIESDKKQGEATLVCRGKASCVYVCASPGGKYKVRVQPRRRGVPGRWSKSKVCQLAPVAVQDLEACIQKTTSGEKELEFIWTSAGNHVMKYDIQVYSHSLYEETGKTLYKRFEHENSFKNGDRIKATVSTIPPGKFYRCEVTGILGNFSGQTASSSRVFAGLEKPEYFSTELDKDDPYHKAIIKWSKSDAVDIFELAISDSSGKAQTKSLKDTQYHFDSGQPGETYSLSLSWGLSGMFDNETLQETLRLAPGPPSEISVKNTQDEKPGIEISIQCKTKTPDYFIVRVKEKATGTMITENQASKDENLKIENGLRHGEIYLVSVQSVIKGLEKFPSKEALSNAIQIPPEKISRIEISEENGMLIITWPELMTANRCIVEWAQEGDEYQRTTVRGTKFEKRTQGYGETICVRVAGKNGGGIGMFSEEVVYVTVPSPPTDIHGKPSETEPETCIRVTYIDAARHPKKKYAIYANDEKVGETKELQYAITGLTPGSSNMISVTSIVGDRESDHFRLAEPGVTAPGDIKKINYERTEEHGLVFKWIQPNENQPNHYKLEFGYNDGQLQENTSVDTMFRIFEPETQSTCNFRVAAVNRSGQGKWSNWLTLQTAPGPPTEISVKNVEGGKPEIEISIQCKTKTPDYFIVRVKEKATGTLVTEKQASKDKNLKIEDGLRHGEIYVVSVQSVIKGLEKFPSKEALSNAIQIPPEKISRIDISEENGMLIITWPELKTAIRCIVEWAQEGDEYQRMTVRGTKFEKRTQGYGETICVRVAGENGGGIGMFSKEVVYVTVPSPPTDIHGKPSETEPETCIRVMYRDAAHHPKKKYAIYANDEKVGETKELQYAITGLTPGSSNMISITSIIGDRESDHFRLAEPGVTAPGDIKKIDCERTEEHGLVFKWIQPNENQPNHYKLEIGYNDGQLQENTSVDTKFQIFEPEKQSTCKFRVAAVNVSGQGKWSNWSTLQTAPGPPTEISVKNIEGGKPEIEISIQCQTKKPDYLIVRVKEKNTGKIASQCRKSNVENIKVADGLQHGGIYIVSVQCAMIGLEDFPSEEAFSNAIQMPTEKVSHIKISEEDGILVITWLELKTANHYVVDCAQEEDGYQRTIVHGTKFEKHTQGYGETITVRVAGENSGGTGMFSEEVVHATVPSPPTDIQVKPSETEPGSCLLLTYNDAACHLKKKYAIYANNEKVGETKHLQYMITGLIPGSSNVITVTSIADDRESDHCRFVKSGVTVPGEIKQIDWERTEDHGVVFKWNQPNENQPKHYNLEFACNDDQPQEATSIETKFQIFPPESQSTYKFRVAAVNGSGQGEWSEWATFQTAPWPPAKISVNNIQKEKPGIEISIQSKSKKPDYFIVRVKEKITGEIVTELQTSNAENIKIDSGLLHGEIYLVSVQSVTKGIEKFPSKEALSNAVQIPPEKINQIEIIEKHGMLIVTWPELKTANRCIVEWAQEGDEYQRTRVRGTKFEKRTQGYGETISARVAGENGGGIGMFSEEVVYVTVPSPPTDIHGKPSETEPETCIRLRYIDAAHHPKKKYVIYVNDVKVGETKELQYAITSLIAGSSNRISVTSIVDDRESDHCCLAEPVVTAPGDIKKIDCERTEEHGVVFKWIQPNENQPNHYKLEFGYNDGQLQENTSVDTKFRIFEPETQSTCKFRVAAVNGSGQGKWSNWSTLQTAPGPPTEISVKNIEGGKPGIEISIQCETKTPDYFIVRVEEKATGTMITENQASKDENLKIEDGLRHGEIYLVSVQSVIKGLEKFPSKEALSNAIQIPPEKISRIEISEENGMLIITWPELKTANRCIVEWAQEGDEYQRTTVRGTKFEKRTQGYGETICVRVAGENGGGIGMFSEEVVYVTVPSPPTDIHGKPSETEPETCIRVTYIDAAHHPKKKYAIYANDKKVGETKELQYAITALIPGSSNMISVTSIIDDRESAHCRLAVPGVTAPGEVTKIDCEKTEDQGMIFRWNHPDGNQPKSYKLECARNDGQPQEDTSVDTKFQILQPEKQSTYKLRVAAVNSSGQGIWSKWATLWTGPPSPRNITAEIKIDEDGHKYMEIRFDDDRNPAKEYFICLMDERRRRKFYRTRDIHIRIDDFGELADASQLSVEVYSKMGKVRSEKAYATPI